MLAFAAAAAAADADPLISSSFRLLLLPVLTRFCSDEHAGAETAADGRRARALRHIAGDKHARTHSSRDHPFFAARWAVNAERSSRRVVCFFTSMLPIYTGGDGPLQSTLCHEVSFNFTTFVPLPLLPSPTHALKQHPPFLPRTPLSSSPLHCTTTLAVCAWRANGSPLRHQARQSQMPWRRPPPPSR